MRCKWKHSKLPLKGRRLIATQVDCLMTLVPQSACPMNDIKCLCSNQELQSRVQTCLASGCTIRQILGMQFRILHLILSANKFTATKEQQSILCDAPIRDDASLTRRAIWPLFGIALFSVIFRFLARSRLLKGPGFGWDDWTILIALGLLVAASGLLDQSGYTILSRVRELRANSRSVTRIGLGKDTWMLEPQHITDVLYVRMARLIFWRATLMLRRCSSFWSLCTLGSWSSRRSLYCSSTSESSHRPYRPGFG